MVYNNLQRSVWMMDSVPATWNMREAVGPSLFKWFILHVHVYAIIHLDITMLHVQCCNSLITARFSTCLKDKLTWLLATLHLDHALDGFCLVTRSESPLLTSIRLSEMHLAISLYHISLLMAVQNVCFSPTVTVCLCSYIMKQRDSNAPNISSNREKYSERIVIVKYIWDLMRKLEIWRALSKCSMVSPVSSRCLKFKTNCVLLTLIDYR